VTLSEFTRRLATLNLEALANAALAAQAETIGNQLRAALSTTPGGPHDHPWLRTGALRDSIEVQAEGPEALIGSASKVAFWHEHGTSELPPRPTFAPIAAGASEPAAHEVARAVTLALRST
jgi:phage gpG-like protein